MTVTTIARNLRASDVGKYVSIDRGSRWLTGEMCELNATPDQVHITFKLDGGYEATHAVWPFDYIMVTGKSSDGSVPVLPDQGKPVDLGGRKHGDLDTRNK